MVHCDTNLRDVTSEPVGASRGDATDSARRINRARERVPASAVADSSRRTSAASAAATSAVTSPESA